MSREALTSWLVALWLYAEVPGLPVLFIDVILPVKVKTNIYVNLALYACMLSKLLAATERSSLC